MISLILSWCFSDPVPTLSPDGYGLDIVGEGIITPEISRSKGDYRTIAKVSIEQATELSDRCFEEFGSLKVISLPNTLKSIGSNCFSSCSILQNITIPEGVSELKSRTFYGCLCLQSIVLPSTLSVVSTELLFYGCRSLNNFYIHKKNLYFSTDQSNSYLMSYDKETLYKGPGSCSQKIPSSVKKIMNCYSYSCNLKSISFEDSVLEEIFLGAFQGENIESFILPNTTKRIHSSFFSGKIGTLYIPDSVEFFPDDALDQLTVETIKIGKSSQVLYMDSEGIVFNKNQSKIFFIPNTTSVINISSDVNYITRNQILSHNILEVNVIGSPKTYTTVSGIVYTDSGATLYACPGGKKTADIPDTCTKIDYRSFHYSLIEVVHMGDNVERIESQAFIGCENLRSISIPSKLRLISSWAFSNTKKLNLSGKFPPSLYSLYNSCFSGSNVIDLDFSECPLLKSISDELFLGSTLQSIKLPDGVKSIGKRAFKDCKSLASISFPKDLTSLGKEALRGCTNLKEVSFRGASLESIEESCFQESGISTIRIPSSVTEIYQTVFRDCVDLKSIIFDEGSKLRRIRFGIISGCSSLRTFDVPELVSEIEPGAFSNSIGLENFTSQNNSNFTVRNGILFSRDGPSLYAFPGGREHGRIESDVKGIVSMAFKDCKKLADATFDDGSSIVSIGSFTFSGCSRLMSLELPGSIEVIEENSFDGCKKLSHVTFGLNSQLMIISSSTFSGCEKLVSIKFKGKSKLERIGAAAMKGCKILSAMDIPKSVKFIDDSAFEECSELTGVILQAVEEIGFKSFSECRSLKEIMLSSTLTKLGDLAFSKCVGLKKIRFCDPNKAQIGAACFDGCGAAEINVPLSYKETTIGGFTAIRILDSECNFPTSKFTAEPPEFSIDIFSAVVLIEPASERATH